MIKMRTQSKKAQFIFNSVVLQVREEQNGQAESEFVSRLISEIATKTVGGSFR
jgi:hypothetical protein